MIIVITGPTGVGKTKLSVELAKIYNGEIINADSTQVYKGLDIGTAKVTKEEKEGIKHHLFDIREVTDNYTVYDYQIDARQKIKELKSKNKIPILVGGTGLYLKAALYDYKFSKESEKDLEFEELSNEELVNKIKEADYEIDIPVNNRRRLLRIYNKILKETFIESSNPDLLYDDVIFIGLTTNTNNLYQKIDLRTDKMIMELGLVDEVKEFYKKDLRTKALDTAIGYKELYDFFDDEITFTESINKIKQNCRNYAKRQYTFFRNQMDVKWFEVDYDDFRKTINEVVEYIEKK